MPKKPDTRVQLRGKQEERTHFKIIIRWLWLWTFKLLFHRNELLPFKTRPNNFYIHIQAFVLLWIISTELFKGMLIFFRYVMILYSQSHTVIYIVNITSAKSLKTDPINIGKDSRNKRGKIIYFLIFLPHRFVVQKMDKLHNICDCSFFYSQALRKVSLILLPRIIKSKKQFATQYVFRDFEMIK